MTVNAGKKARKVHANCMCAWLQLSKLSGQCQGKEHLCQLMYLQVVFIFFIPFFLKERVGQNYVRCWAVCSEPHDLVWDLCLHFHGVATKHYPSGWSLLTIWIELSCFLLSKLPSTLFSPRQSYYLFLDPPCATERIPSCSSLPRRAQYLQLLKGWRRRPSLRMMSWSSR